MQVYSLAWNTHEGVIGENTFHFSVGKQDSTFIIFDNLIKSLYASPYPLSKK